MNDQHSQRTVNVFIVCLFANLTFMPYAAASTTSAKSAHIELGHDEEIVTFAGRCPNGASYRLIAYQKLVEGLAEPFYDYQGPAGQGTVSTDATPKTMAARVCRHTAEIIHKDYWR